MSKLCSFNALGEVEMNGGVIKPVSSSKYLGDFSSEDGSRVGEGLYSVCSGENK